MARIFISYSRADRQFVDQFIPLVRRVYGNDSVWFDDDIHGGVDWWQTILAEVGKCDVFVYLISNESLESPYCQAELREALRLKKQILPIIVRRLNPPYPGSIEDDLAVILRRTQYVDMAGGFRNPDTISALYAALTRLLSAIPPQPIPPITTTPTPEPPVPDKPKRDPTVHAAYIGGGFAVFVAIIAGIFGLWQGVFANPPANPTPEPTTAVAQVAEAPTATQGISADEARATGAAQAFATLTALAPTDTLTITLTPTDTPISASDIQQTAQAEIFATQTVAAQTQAVIAQATQQAVLTEQFSAGSTATYIAQLSLTPPVTPSLTPSPEPTPVPPTATTTAVRTTAPTAVASEVQATEMPAVRVVTTRVVSNTGTQAIFIRSGPGTSFNIIDRLMPGGGAEVIEERDGWYRVSSNGWVSAQAVVFSEITRTVWTPVEREFDGVTMVLVPAGCFMMGSADGRDDERPVHEQCFDQPFWIDKYEVTQGQFSRLGGRKASNNAFSGDNRPVETITWFEARDFCALRGARLPTEREWEYAARGPDNLRYPWGNTWNANNAVWNRNDSQGTANVGSIPAGASWVGALDMAGNVWEWTSSLYRGYPYVATDGREDDANRTDMRVLRGGSWWSDSSDSLRAAFRNWFNPVNRDNYVGFRCARSP